MPIDPILRDLTELWSKGRYYQAIALLGEDASLQDMLPPIDGVVLTEIQSAALLEAEWLDHLLSGSWTYDGDEVLLILMKRQRLGTVADALRHLDLPLNISIDEIDQAIRNRFAARKMLPASRRIYHNLYLATKQK